MDAGGQLSYYLNGSLLGAASPGLPTDKDLYLVLDLQASLRSVRLLPEITKPMTQQELEKDLLIGIVKSDQVSLAALEAKVAEPDGSDAAKAQDRRKRLPLHYLCQNGKADAEMLRCLTGVDSATIGAMQLNGGAWARWSLMATHASSVCAWCARVRICVRVCVCACVCAVRVQPSRRPQR